MIGTPQVGRLLVLIAAVTSIALPLLLDAAHSAEVSTSQEATTKNAQGESRREMDTVTVEATRERELKRQISSFVSSFDVTYLNDSLQRWNTPICPLVAGLSSEAGGFVLARLSQVAREAHAPLGAEHCRPNLYIVVTSAPDLLIERWVKRDGRSFNTCSGFGYIREFLHSRRPIRVLYNAALRSSDGGNRDVGALYVAGWRLDFSLNSCVSAGVAGTRLSYGAVQALSSVVIVVDSARIAHLNIGQLADYVSMVGLAPNSSGWEYGYRPQRPGTIPGIRLAPSRTEPVGSVLPRWPLQHRSVECAAGERAQNPHVPADHWTLSR